MPVKLKVDKWWKGNGESQVVLKTLTIRKGQKVSRNSCEFFFTTGQSYLVFADFYKDWLTTDDCDRTKLLSRAAKDLEVLGENFRPEEKTNPEF